MHVEAWFHSFKIIFYKKKIILCITSLHIAYSSFIKIKIFLSDFDNIDNIWKLVW